MDKKRLACMAGFIALTLLFSCKKEHTNKSQVDVSNQVPKRHKQNDTEQANKKDLSPAPDYTAIYYANPDGSNITRITPNDPGLYCYRHRWSPNGQFVLFVLI